MIIAVDFDGVLVKDEFPNIGKPIEHNISMVKWLIESGHEVILWTSRVEKALEDAVEFCRMHGLEFCAVNDNAPSNKAKYAGVYKEAPRKVYADVYIDDHSAGYNPVTLKGDIIDSINRRRKHNGKR